MDTAKLKDRLEILFSKKTLARLGQFLYLTISNFTKNTLWESAAACAFGFIFSFIPITLIIFAVLMGILRVYPNIYNFIISFIDEIEALIDIKPTIDTLMGTKSISIFNIFLGVWVIWMARKLFNSIIMAMNRIFRSVSRRKSWFNQLLTFLSEFVMTLVIAVVIIAAFAFTQFLEQPFFKAIFGRFPFLYSQSSHNIVVLIMYFVIFVGTTIAYRIIPGTKPMLRRCFFYAALSTVSFFVVSFFINLFLNVANYNTIYGTISSLVVLMMKVYLFFILFLFFAQMIYVSQFFDVLLRSEIYLIPDSESGSLGDMMMRYLFLNPSEIQNDRNTVFLKKDETLFTGSQKVDFVYYIKRGFVAEKKNGVTEQRTQGAFLGDVQCILNEPYDSTVTALCDCELISFSAEEFMQIIEKSHHAARKAVSKISDYTAGVYGSTE